MKRGAMTMKRTFIVLLCCMLLSIISQGIGFAGDLEISMQCPDNVTVGQALDVTITSIKNTDSENPVTISRALAGFGGNMGNSATGIGLFGPFNRTWTEITLQPGATDGIQRQIRIIDKVPSSLAGKVAAATVVLTKRNYASIGGDSCGVNVVK
jgi:hypothetical protein